MVSARKREGRQQLRVGGLGQQRPVAALDRGRAAAGRELHQCRRVRNLPIIGIRQNRRQVIESLTSLHKLS